MRSLAVRLSLVVLALLLAFGAFALWVAERGARAYFLEFTQRLNAPIARYMAERSELLRDGRIDAAALASLAEDIMAINPSVELYLLDPAGDVVAQASAANSIAQPRVSLAPIHAFLAADVDRSDRLPLGDNPRRADDPRAFSAHPIVEHGRIVGYVYAVLAGRQHETLLAAIRSSHSVRTVVLTLGGALLLTALGGALVSFTLTRRLHRLTRRVQRWRENQGGKPIPPGSSDIGPASRPRPPARYPDEIDRLADAYEDMTVRLHAQYRALADADGARRELLAGVSHDLRTPLTTLQGYLETLLLKHGRLEPALAHRYLSIAHRQARRLERLVEELFELSRLDGGTVELAPERFSLLELAHDAAQDVAIAARGRDVDVSVAPAESGSGRFDVLTDIALVQRVFDNLLGNALRHVDRGGRVGVSLERLADAVRVTVADDGRGMSAEAAARVFEPRFSGARDELGDDDRAGLGLAIARGVVALHGGTIDVESRLGTGTAFSFTLPSAAPATRHSHAADTPPASDAPNARTAPAGPY